MRIVFMGTPKLAATILRGLVEHHEVIAVFTRPDAVRARGKKLVPSEVGKLADELSIPVYKPASMRDAEAVALLRSLRADVVCVSAYGAILPREALEAAAFGCLNVHTSLLPRWRGAAPIERAILEGDELTGVCIMRMEEGLDTGPYCVRREVEIGESGVGELAERLAQLGADALLEALSLMEQGKLTWTEQGEAGMCYAAKIAKGELNPQLDDTASRFAAKVRASSDGRPARAIIAGRSLAIESARLAQDELALEIAEGHEAGDALFRAKRLFAVTIDGAVEICRVKPDGKKSMDALAFAGGIQGIKNSNIAWGSF